MIAPTDIESVPNEDAILIEDRVQTFSKDELLERYHELVDKRFEEERLPYTEHFELERIEARLAAEDRDEVKRLASVDDDHARQRDELLTSIENLVARLRNRPPRA